MSQPAALFMLPFRKESDEEGMEATAIHVAEILEDLRVAEGVERALRSTGHMPLRAVQVSACGRVVILTGRVPSDYLKQAAQAAALGLLGVEKLHNYLEVVSDEQWRQGSSAS
jgi:osmotically-inducible protein OsmY